MDERFVGNVSDEAGFGDEGYDPAHAAQHMAPAELRRQLVRRLYSVLHGQHKGIRSDQLPDPFDGIGHLPALYAEHDDIHVAGFPGVARDLDRGQREIALRAFYPKSAFAQRL